VRNKILVLGVFLLVLVSSGCTGTTTSTTNIDEGNTVKKVVDNYYRAHENGDYEEMYRYLLTKYTLIDFENWIMQKDRGVYVGGRPIYKRVQDVNIKEFKT
jgi:type VI protein secretion system component Hcp